MEFKKDMIHMEVGKAQGSMQTALEEDINIPENKEDVDKILLAKGKVKIEEVKSTSAHAFIRGKIMYTILYRTLGEKLPIQSINGTLPFYEDIYMNGLENGDYVSADGILEDVSVHLINSRKLNLRSLLLLHAISEEIGEEEVCVDLTDAEDLACQKKKIQFLELVTHKKDIFRIREEVELPKSMPNITSILWKDIRLQNINCIPQVEKLYVKGELVVFVAYEPLFYPREGEEEHEQINWYEAKVPFQGELACQGSLDKMLADIQVSLDNEVVEIRQDADQENRMLGLDCSLDMDIRLYDSKEMELVTDAYSVNNEVICTLKKNAMRKLSLQKEDSISLQEKLQLSKEEGDVTGICYATCSVHLEDGTESIASTGEAEQKQQAVTVQGYLQTEVLYQIKNGDGKQGFSAETADYPFSLQAELPEGQSACEYRIMAVPQEFNALLGELGVVDIEAHIQLQIHAYCDQEQELLSDIRMEPFDYEKRKEMPGMMIYFVQNGDTLWNIGKKYYMDVERIKEMNQLTTDNISAGDKLLLLKEFKSNTV